MPNDAPLTLLVNPRGMEADIGVEFLVSCFGATWNQATYQWYLQRAFQGETPDRLVLVDAGRVAATAGIAYRQVRTPNGALHRVGIMVAASTAPDQRGRGRFSRLWKEAVVHCAEHHCVALLGFVTAENATYRELRRVGSTAIPSVYIISVDSLPEPTGRVLDVARAPASDWPNYADAALHPQRSTAVTTGFHYPDAGEWRSQFVDRPYPVELLRIGDRRAIVEPVGDTDRLQWLEGDAQERNVVIAALAAHSHRARRRFFMYATAEIPAADLEACGLQARPGFMMALATGPERESVVRGWSALPWSIHSGDRL